MKVANLTFGSTKSVSCWEVSEWGRCRNRRLAFVWCGISCRKDEMASNLCNLLEMEGILDAVLRSRWASRNQFRIGKTTRLLCERWRFLLWLILGKLSSLLNCSAMNVFLQIFALCLAVFAAAYTLCFSAKLFFWGNENGLMKNYHFGD